MKTDDLNVVASVVARHLCCGCGTCVAICPTSALAMTDTPAGLLVAQMPDASLCTRCGLCLSVCPGAMLTDKHNKPFEAISNPDRGTIRASYWGWARSVDARLNAASGGVVTAIVRHLLETGSVQAALVTRWSPEDPLRHEAFVARAPGELATSQKSRYCPVALNATLCELMDCNRVAVVGLPCHLHGIEHAARLLDLPETIRLGLFCERTLSTLLIDRLKSLAGVSGRIARFDYKNKGDRGWPGDVHVQPDNAAGIFLDRNERMRLKDPYTPVRCRLCFDKFNVLADIACGDGYGAPHSDEGVSAVLVRTERGEQVIADAEETLHLEKVGPETVLEQHHPTKRRRDCLAYSVAFTELCPDAPRVLPRFYTADRDRVERSRGRRFRVTLSRAIEFETAADMDEACRIARTGERRQRIRRMPRNALKWCLGRIPWGQQLLRLVRSRSR